MAVFREIEVKWKGESKQFSPNFLVLQRIDRALMAAGTSFMKMNEEVRTGLFPLYDMAAFMALFLGEAGFEADPADLVIDLKSAEEDGVNLFFAFVAACSPQPNDSKKADAPARK